MVYTQVKIGFGIYTSENRVYDYPMGDDSNALRLGKSVYTYGLLDNPTQNNWYHWYYFVDTDETLYSNGIADYIELHATKINSWIHLKNIERFLTEYTQNEYEYGVTYNAHTLFGDAIVHKIIINTWNYGVRVSTVNLYPQGDKSRELKFGKAIFTKGLPNNPTQNDWYHMYYYVNGDYAYSGNDNSNYVQVWVKLREAECV
eukprot:119618_1